MEVAQRSRGSRARNGGLQNEVAILPVLGRSRREVTRGPRITMENGVEYAKDSSCTSEEAMDPLNTRLLIRFLHHRPDLSHAYSTFRRFGRVRSCFLCAKQSKTSIIIDFESKESALALKSSLTIYVTPDGLETRVKVFWGKRHHQKLPWEWKTPSLVEMVTRAEEVHDKQVVARQREVHYEPSVDTFGAMEELAEDRSSEADCWATLLGSQPPESRARHGVGRYPLRLSDPWFEGSELQKNPRLSLGTLLDRSSGSWGAPSPLALSGSQSSLRDSTDSQLSSPASSLTSGRSYASSSLFSSSSSVMHSPRSGIFSSGHWSPGDTSSSDVDSSDEWSASSLL